MAGERLSQDVLERKYELLSGAVVGLLNAAMMHVGQRLGLYEGLAGAGAVTPEALAQRTGHSPRFVREWLCQQAAAGVVEYAGEGRFELRPETATLLTDRESQVLAASLDHLPTMFQQAIRSQDAFRTGRGTTFAEGGEENARLMDAVLGIWSRRSLVAEALPAVEGLLPRLEAGAVVADVGCGPGAALLAVARAFPRSRVHGYDPSLPALAMAREKLLEAGIGNVTLHDPRQEPLPDRPTFDLVMTINCLHDMPRPDETAAAIRRAIKPDGVWFIVDLDAAPTLEDQISRPGAEMLFALSLAICLQSGTSEPGGMALGAAGLPEAKLRELVLAAGFRSFRRVPGLEDPANAFYEARP